MRQRTARAGWRLLSVGEAEMSRTALRRDNATSGPSRPCRALLVRQASEQRSACRPAARPPATRGRAGRAGLRLACPANPNADAALAK